MNVTRRKFLQYCIGSATALGLNTTLLGRLERALAAEAQSPAVIWVQGANCSGCTVSLANLFSAEEPEDVYDLLINSIDLVFHPTLMGATGDLATTQLKTAFLKPFILAVEGGIPTAFGGRACMVCRTAEGRDFSALDVVRILGPRAAEVLAIGTCASFGGVPSGNPNPAGIIDVGQAVGRPVVNIPGCPIHPDWVAGSLAHLLAGGTLDLDADQRPKLFFNEEIHDHCPRKEAEETETFGRNGYCVKELGCKGPRTRADCFKRQWNSGVNWCIEANALCIGCTERAFPDGFSPFYQEEDEEHEGGEEHEDENRGEDGEKEHEEHYEYED